MAVLAFQSEQNAQSAQTAAAFAKIGKSTKLTKLAKLLASVPAAALAISLALAPVALAESNSGYNANQKAGHQQNGASTNSHPVKGGQAAKSAARPQNIDEWEKISILFQAEAVVDGAEFTLGEIAKLEGRDDQLIEKLAQTKIGRSPLPGGSLVASSATVLSKLRGVTHPDFLVFPGAAQTKVKRAAIHIAGAEVAEAVLLHIRKAHEGQDVTPTIKSKTSDFLLPKGDLFYEVKEQGVYKKEGGYRNYAVEFSIDGKMVKTVQVNAYLKMFKDVYVAADTIRRDQVIKDEDLVKVRASTDRLPLEHFENKEEAIGKMARRVIGSNELIKPNALETAPLINSGDLLTLVYETDALRLSVPGVAMNRGALGDRIAVRNTDSKIVVQAIVRDRNLAYVN